MYGQRKVLFPGLYNPEIARDGAYVILTKAEDVKFGNVQLPETITEFSAGGENGLFTLKPVLRHRVTVNFNAEADGVAADMVLDDLIARVQHTIFMA